VGPPLVIAIDGPSASGKGTLARRLAAALDLAHLDSGLLYRAVAALVLAGGEAPDDRAFIAAAEQLQERDLARPDLRSEAVGRLASLAASLPEVRRVLLGYQRRFASRPPGGKRGAVLDGRDIGTVICPEAPVKLFVTATAEARASRRFAELQARAEPANYAAVLQDLQDRDRRDQERAASPLKPAADAVVLDTTTLDADQAFAKALEIVRQRLAAKPKA